MARRLHWHYFWVALLFRDLPRQSLDECLDESLVFLNEKPFLVELVSLFLESATLC